MAADDGRREFGGIFIVGCPRSGTYLLSSIMAREFGLAIPLETHFIPLFHRFLPLWGDLRREANRRRLLEDIFDFLTIWTWASRELDSDQELELTLLGLRPRAEELLAGETYGDIIRNLFQAFAQRHGAPYWADKSAFYRPTSLARFQAAMPGLKVVHCVRDPRDVVLSWREIWCGPRTVGEAAAAWAGHVEAYRAWGRGRPEQYTELRFEDLLLRPEEELDRLSGFLGLPRRAGADQGGPSKMDAALSKLKTHARLGGAIDPSNREKWRSKMPGEDVRYVEWLAREPMRGFGYQPATGAEPSAGLRLRRLRERLAETFTSRRVQLLCKDMLPLALRLRSLAGIPLPTFFTRLQGRGDCRG